MVRIAAHSQQHHSKPWPLTHGTAGSWVHAGSPACTCIFPLSTTRLSQSSQWIPLATTHHQKACCLCSMKYVIYFGFSATWRNSIYKKKKTKKQQTPKQPTLRKLLLPYCSRRCSDLICWHLSLGRETSESPTSKGKLLRVFKKAYIKQQGWQEPISLSAWDTQYS